MKTIAKGIISLAVIGWLAGVVLDPGHKTAHGFRTGLLGPSAHHTAALAAAGVAAALLIIGALLWRRARRQADQQPTGWNGRASRNWTGR